MLPPISFVDLRLTTARTTAQGLVWAATSYTCVGAAQKALQCAKRDPALAYARLDGRTEDNAFHVVERYKP